MKLSPVAGMQGIGWANETFIGKSGEASATITKGSIVECTLTALEPDDNQEVKIAVGADAGIYGVALEDILPGANGQCLISGKVECFGGATIAAGVTLMPQSGGEAIAWVAGSTCSIGFSVDALTDGTLGTILFDGWCKQQGAAT